MKLLDREKRYIKHVIKKCFDSNISPGYVVKIMEDTNVFVGTTDEGRVKITDIVSTGRDSYITGKDVQNYELLHPTIKTGDCSLVYLHAHTTMRLPYISLGSYSIVSVVDNNSLKLEKAGMKCPFIVNGNDGCHVSLSFNSACMVEDNFRCYKIVGDRFKVNADASYGACNDLLLQSLSGDICVYENDELIYRVPDKRSACVDLRPRFRDKAKKKFDIQMKKPEFYISRRGNYVF